VEAVGSRQAFVCRRACGVVPPIPCPPFPRLRSSMVLQEAWIFTRSILLFFDRTLIFL